MLVSMKEIITKAYEGHYCVMAPNFNNESEARAAVEVAEEMNCPIILDFVYGCHPDIIELGRIATKIAEDATVPVCVNQDHGGCLAHNMAAIRAGFTGIMVDRSTLPLEENIKQVREVAEICHSLGIGVEGELGHVGANDETIEDQSLFTDPLQAKRYVEETGVDQLAISIGTAHGTYKIAPHLRFDVLEAIRDTVNVPLVLHGSSGTGDDQLRKCCELGINKMNVYTDLLTASIKAAQGFDFEKDSMLEFYKIFLGGYKTRLKEFIEFSGSKGKAWTKENTEGISNKKIVFTQDEFKQSM
ncbi:MAG: class II fructose-bisphosphate aldolase [Holdemanella sp.]|nr:class II fructose-bisphosphate aldolase [Holdemanella sp.]